jgi:hypothetical protein
VRDGLKLSKLRAEHPMLTLIELIEMKKHEKLTLACKGDTLPALLVRFHNNLAGFSNSNNDFCSFLGVITRYYHGPYTLLETGKVFFTRIILSCGAHLMQISMNLMKKSLFNAFDS